MKFKQLIFSALVLILPQLSSALNSTDVNVRLLSGYIWMDNSCTSGSPLGKVISFRVKNIKGTLLQDVSVELTGLNFVAAAGVSYTSGTPLFQCKTPTKVFLGNIPAGDSVTAFFYVGYNCLLYPSNSTVTTDYVSSAIKLADNNTGTVTNTYNSKIYVVRNSNNNTISILTASTNAVGTITTVSVAMSISNVKPANIIDMEISTTQAFPAGYSIVGCKITSSTISDFPVNSINTYYAGNIAANLPSGGTVTIEWYLQITGASTGITSSNIVPYVVSDAGSSQRWQANTTAFTGTATPSNPITISKRANKSIASTSDTIVYTVVVKNSSSTADVTIDRLVDKLPRDYKFKYLETNTGVFPRLVTYNNSTVYPAYLDTGYLLFGGHKEISSGVFSYIIPKQDSIKLIYSVQVSSTVGVSDTNFITAYVGTSQVASASAKTSVLSMLPVNMLNFSAKEDANFVNVQWTANGLEAGEKFELLKKGSNTDNFDLLEVYQINDSRSAQSFNYLDFKSQANGLVIYQLRHYKLDNLVNVYNTTFNSIGQSDFNCIVKSDAVTIYLDPNFGDEVQVEIIDLSGRKIFEGIVLNENGKLNVPFKSEDQASQVLLISVTNHSHRLTRRVFSK